MSGTAITAAGKDAVLFSVTKGALVVGTGLLDLANNTWHLINAKKTSGSEFTLPVGYPFKTPEVANKLTPEVGDDAYPLTFTKLCKVNASYSATVGSIDVTDDCGNGYKMYISDGYTDLGGTFTAFQKFNDPNGGIVTGQLEIIKRFYDYIYDNGTGTYTLTAKDSTELYLAMLINQNFSTVSVDTATYLLMPVMLEGLTTGKDLTTGQSFDVTFKKGEGPAVFYERKLNATDTVF